MKAAILVEQNAPLIVAEVEIPELAVGQVLVKVEYSGICGKQLDEISGKRGLDLFLPHLLGHEGAGIVVDIGPGVRKVKSGDQLRLIGKQFKIPYEILMDINRINHPESLQVNQIIKVINGPFHAKVYLSTFTMDLFLQNMFVRSFSIGIGKPGRETPTGLWVVEPAGKLIKPTWTDPDTGKTYEAEDPDYPLGSRWIGLKGIDGQAVGVKGIAFHGTNDPNYIGSASSRGCIRLHNGDVILIYNLMMPGLSQIRVVD